MQNIKNQISHFGVSSVLTKIGSRTSSYAAKRFRHSCKSKWEFGLAQVYLRKPVSNQLVLEPNAAEIKDESAIDYEQGRAS